MQGWMMTYVAIYIHTIVLNSTANCIIYFSRLHGLRTFARELALRCVHRGQGQGVREVGQAGRRLEDTSRGDTRVSFLRRSTKYMRLSLMSPKVGERADPLAAAVEECKLAPVDAS